MMINKDNKASFYAIFSGFLYGFLGYFGLSAIKGDMSASNMLFWRFFIASIVILIALFPQLKKSIASYQQMLGAFSTGALYYGVSTLLYFLASQFIGTGLAMVIFFTYPVLIMVLNFFIYNQKIPKAYYVAIVFILIGMLFLIDGNELSFNLWGLLFGMISAFFYACYLIASKRNALPPQMSTLMVCLGCMTTCLIVSLMNHTLTLPASFHIWGHLWGIAIIATAVPMLLMLYSLQYISSEKASILSVLEPVFVVILGIVLLGEALRFWSAIGIILVLSGALITLFSHKIKWQYLRAYWTRTRIVGEEPQ